MSTGGSDQDQGPREDQIDGDLSTLRGRVGSGLYTSRSFGEPCRVEGLQDTEHSIIGVRRIGRRYSSRGEGPSPFSTEPSLLPVAGRHDTNPRREGGSEPETRVFSEREGGETRVFPVLNRSPRTPSPCG